MRFSESNKVFIYPKYDIKTINCLFICLTIDNVCEYLLMSAIISM